MIPFRAHHNRSWWWLGLLMLGLIAVALGLIVGTQSLIFIIGGLLAVIVLAMGLRSPLALLLGVAFFLPFERIGSYDFSIGTIRISQLLAVALIAAWVLRTIVVRHKHFRPNPIAWLIGLFLLVNLISLTNALNFQRSLVVFLVTCFTLIFSLVIPEIVDSPTKTNRIVNALLITTFIVTIFGLYQFAGDMMGLPTTLTGLREQYTKAVFGFPRIQSTALEPLYFANFLLLPLSLLFTLLVSRAGKIRLWWLIGLLLIGGLNLVLTVSRGGYLGIAVSFVCIGILYLRKVFNWKFLLPVIGVFLIILFLVPRLLGLGDIFNLNTGTFVSHVTNALSGPAYNERLATFEVAQQAWRDHPWFGVGPGGYGPYAAAISNVEPKDGWAIVNNEFMELLAETGVFGLIVFSAILIVLVFRSIKAIVRAQDPWLRAIMIGLLATILAFVAQYQTFSVLYIMHIWFTFGLAIAVQNLILSPKRP
ncbi:MAG: O-antigen ligase family protein [Patescibacteria group bacterium]|jgi:O-antigen ligase